MYFNLSASKLAKKHIDVDKEKLNPNLLKLFFRHYPDLAFKSKIEIDSEEEDYEITAVHHDSDQLTLHQLNQMPKKGVPKPPVRTLKEEGLRKKDLFVTDSKQPDGLKDSDLKNKYDFPSLTENSGPTAAPKPSSGWGTNDTYLYYKEGVTGKLSKKEKEELFPSLSAVTGPPSKPKPAEAPKPVTTAPPAPKPITSEQVSWMDTAKQKQKEALIANSAVIMIKAKKKKK